ncbi:MAG: hypothetical protein ACRCZP_11745 [Phycicoccus sp.]
MPFNTDRPVVVHDDVVLHATARLRAWITDRPALFPQPVWVSSTVPDPRRDRMVTIRRDGGPGLPGNRDAARITVNVWAPSEAEVNTLAARIRAVLVALLADGQPVCRVDDLSGPVAVPDASRQHRVFFTQEWITRGE